MRSLITVAAVLAAIVLLAACGSSSSTAPAAGTSAAPTAAAPTASCHAQFEAWRHGAARPAGKEIVRQLGAVQAASKVADIPRMLAALKGAGRGATALEAYPIPRCADPHGYWQQILTLIRSAADNAHTGSGLGALMLALIPLKQVPPLLKKLGAELKQTAGVSKAFG